MTVTPGQLFRIALTAHGRGFALAAATALLMLHALAEAAIPVVIGATIDFAVLPAEPAALALWIGVLLAVFLVLTASYQAASRLMVSIYGIGEQALRQLTLERLLRPRLSQHTLSPGEALAFVTSDTYRVAGVAWSVAQQCATIAAIGGAGCAMLAISPVATLVVCVATFGMMGLMRVVSRPLERRGRIEQEAATEAGAVAADFMAGFRVLVGMGARGVAVQRYVTASGESRVAATSAARALAGYAGVSAGLAALVTAALAGISAWLASDGAISLGELVTMLGLAQFISGSLAYVGSFPSNWIHKYASAKRLAEAINAPDVLPEPGTGRSVPRSAETVLSFSVRGETGVAMGIASDSAPMIRVDVAPGEMLGLRPADSAAARSLARALGLRSAPARGSMSLRIDGEHRDLADIDPLAYRRRVIALPHRHTIGTGSLRRAVRGREGSEPPNDTLVGIAALGDTVDEIGWDAQVGEAGRRLSGGQRQRIGIARGLHAGAEVLVLDEPTSAVDAVTESRIAAGLAAHAGAKIVISSSPALLAACDRVVAFSGCAAAHEAESGEPGE